MDAPVQLSAAPVPRFANDPACRAALIEAARGKSQLYAQLGTGALPVVVKSINGTVGLRRLDAQGRAFEMARP